MTEYEEKNHVSLVHLDKTQKHRTLILDTSISIIVTEHMFNKVHGNEAALMEFVVKNAFKNNSRFVISATSKEKPIPKEYPNEP